MNKFDALYKKIIMEMNGEIPGDSPNETLNETPEETSENLNESSSNNLKIESYIYEYENEDWEPDSTEPISEDKKDFNSFKDFWVFVQETFGVGDVDDLYWEIAGLDADISADPNFDNDFYTYESLLDYFKNNNGKYRVWDYGGTKEIIFYVD